MPAMNPPTAGAPVHNLQRMLRTLTSVHREIPLLSPDGIFGEETLEAVMIFQRLMGLPVNGTVDQRTWDALVEEHHQVSHEPPPFFPRVPPPSSRGRPPPCSTPSRGCFWRWPGFWRISSLSPLPERWTPALPPISAVSSAGAATRKPGPWTGKPGSCSATFTKPSSPGTPRTCNGKSSARTRNAFGRWCVICA